MTKLVVDNQTYCSVIIAMGMRKSAPDVDLSAFLDEDTEIELKNKAKMSMGSEITESDLKNITSLATQVRDLSQYRAELYDYLKKRMMAIAPNLTLMVGELVGARLLAHAGSLVSLAKYPASTVQLLGAEKALFRALKAKGDTPKYGLIYHAAFVNAASQQNKAKIARTLACKTSLSARVDAFVAQSESGDTTPQDVASKLWTKMQKRIAFVEGREVEVVSKSLAGQVFSKHEFGGKTENAHDEKADFQQVGSKRKREDDEEEEKKAKKKRKKEK